MKYTIYRAPGWHGEAFDPVVCTTEEKSEAMLIAGCRADIGMPGDCNKFSAYATDADGQDVGRIESYRCADCGELVEWGDGPTGMMDGEVLDSPGSVEKHLVSWVCEECARS
jgi:hypothetical protein